MLPDSTASGFRSLATSSFSSSSSPEPSSDSDSSEEISTVEGLTIAGEIDLGLELSKAGSVSARLTTGRNVQPGRSAAADVDRPKENYPGRSPRRRYMI